MTFEELGVDRLFIDESHYYKNLFLFTPKCGMWAALLKPKHMKSSDLFMKCRYLGRTDRRAWDSVCNRHADLQFSMVELYTIQRYLQYNTLVQNNLQHFDCLGFHFRRNHYGSRTYTRGLYFNRTKKLTVLN